MRSIRCNKAVVFACAALPLAMLLVPQVESLAYTLTGASFATSNVSFRVNPNFSDGTAGTAQQQVDAIVAAANEWNVSGQANFSFAYAGTTSNATVAADGENTVHYSHTDGSGALAVCYWWTSGGSTTNFDIRFFDRDGGFDYVWSNNPGWNQFDIQSVATHELGHALGLDHSSVSGAVMWPSVSAGSTGNRTLHADDVSGVQAIYGAAPATTPDPQSVTPNSGWIEGGMTVQILGAGFATSGVSVTFGGVPATSVTPVSTTRIDCVVPAGLTGGSVDVAVSVAGQTGTLTGGFDYLSCRLTGPLQFGQANFIEVKIPADAGMFYQGAISYGNSGIPLAWAGDPTDTRVLPLELDLTFHWSVNFSHLVPYFHLMNGTLDVTGYGQFIFFLPDIPEARGTRWYFALTTVGPQHQNNIKTITNAATGVFPQ